MLVSPCTRVNRKGRHVVASVHFHHKPAVHDNHQSVIAWIGHVSGPRTIASNMSKRVICGRETTFHSNDTHVERFFVL